MFKKLLRFIIIVIPIFGIAYLLINEPLPTGEQGPEAERLTDQMLSAVNYAAWDSTVAVKWTFAGRHKYLWDKNRNWVRVEWDDKTAWYNTKTSDGKATQNGEPLTGNDLERALQKAWKHFANDSFWLASPFKVRDPGTMRMLIETDSTDALLVTYTSGGITPGDSYLWLLDDNYQPTAWKMWVSVVPIGGLEYTWEDWDQYSTGAWLSSYHEGFIPVKISDIRLAMSVEELNEGVDPFAGL